MLSSSVKTHIGLVQMRQIPNQSVEIESIPLLAMPSVICHPRTEVMPISQKVDLHAVQIPAIWIRREHATHQRSEVLALDTGTGVVNQPLTMNIESFAEHPVFPAHAGGGVKTKRSPPQHDGKSPIVQGVDKSAQIRKFPDVFVSDLLGVSSRMPRVEDVGKAPVGADLVGGPEEVGREILDLRTAVSPLFTATRNVDERGKCRDRYGMRPDH